MAFQYLGFWVQGRTTRDRRDGKQQQHNAPCQENENRQSIALLQQRPKEKPPQGHCPESIAATAGQ
jgi:hypothetical protein